MRICALGLLLALAGCASTDQTPAPAPTVTADEAIERDGVEQLAIDAVGDYFAVSAEIAGDGGDDPDRIAEVVTSNWLPQEITGFAALRALGSSQAGVPEVTKIEVSAIRGIAAVTEVVLHACTSLDGVTIRTADGDETDVPLGTSLVTIYVVPEDGILKVDGVEPWTEVSWCAES
jgi:hypothetical protein